MTCELLLVMCCLTAILAVVESGTQIDGAYVPGVQELRRRFLQESGYDPSLRPTNHSAEPTAVTVVIPLSEVTYFALVGDWFTVALYFCEYWKDPRFSWDPRDYGGAHRFSGTTKQIWWPRIDVVNAKRQDVDLLQQRVTVYNDSNAWSCAAMKVKTPCRVDLSDFPNDKQTCSLRVGASAYSDSEVRMAGYVTWGVPHVNASTEWVLEHLSFGSHAETNRSFIDVVFHLRRTARRHRYTFTMPGISSALALLAAFWIPPDSDRRMTLACLNILALAVVLNRMSLLMAASVTVPKMILFLGLGTLVGLFTAAASILIISASRSNSRIQVPGSLHRFLSGFVAMLLCINRTYPTTVTESYDRQEVTTFNGSYERRRRWLIFAQAVDRVFFVGFAFAILVFFL
ncbi:acetylcholine receptor subunit beta-like [Rhipicephalus sanguineus]|uniref:acetylcholine receptor subunit beta-like n=1 Tax=Rhipicephalus sanguineus TaxID=34632 RepID=UPI0018962E3E|nr:acetylcholine receptor subunit beta-like [Rhipicephalus sanguineus]